MFGWDLRGKRTFGTVRLMDRTYVRRRRVAVFLLVTGMAIVCLRASPGSAEARHPIPSSARATRYVIRPGDTLWSIARRLVPGQDPRLAVDAILVRNGIDPAHLIPGQAIVVPDV
jgi:hypothetical protein